MAKTVKPITGVDRIFYATITEDNGVDFPTYSPWKRLFGAKEFGYVQIKLLYLLVQRL